MTKDGVRTLVTATVNDVTVRDSVILGKLRPRRAFAANLEEQDGTVKAAAVEADLLYIGQALEKSLRPSPNGHHELEIDPALAKQAEELLNDPALLQHIYHMIGRLDVVGEDENRLILYLAYTSRILPKPMQIIIKGISSSGKSFLAHQVILLMPPEAYNEISELTPQALCYTDKDLRHKIVVIAEKNGTERAEYKVRTAQSEGVLTLWTVIKDPQSGEMRTTEKKVPGPILFVETTTSAQINDENETRCLSLYTDDSAEQTRRVLHTISESYRYDRPLVAEAELAVYHTLQQLLQPYPVTIPYAGGLEDHFPPAAARVRRDFQRFLVLVEIITLLHQRQRPKVADETGQIWLIATAADYAIARVLAERAFKDTLTEIPPKSQNLLAILKRLREERTGATKQMFGLPADAEEPEFTFYDLVHQTGMHVNTVDKWLEPLFQLGMLEDVGPRGGGRNQKRRFTISTEAAVQLFDLPVAKRVYAQFPQGDPHWVHPVTGETHVLSDGASSGTPDVL